MSISLSILKAKNYYTDLYIRLEAKYTKKVTLCAGIKLYKMSSVSILLLQMQPNRGGRFQTCPYDFMVNPPRRF